MEILIIYFSGTGNTELITTELASRLKKAAGRVEAVSVEDLGSNERVLNFKLRTADLIGFGFPVYKFSYPHIMKRIFTYLENLKPEGKPFFVFSTYCRFASNSLHRLAAAVEDASGAKGPVAMQAFKCPSNGIASLKSEQSREYRDVMYFEPGIGKRLDDFVNNTITGLEAFISEKTVLKHQGSLIDKRREELVGRIEKARYSELLIDHEFCVVCGLCAKKCPDSNLMLDEKEDGSRFIRIKDAHDCLHCLRCLHICPKNAVSFAPLAQGPMRYTPKIRKALFSEAEQLPPGAHEPGTRFAKYRWAFGNLRDYILMRLR